MKECCAKNNTAKQIYIDTFKYHLNEESIYSDM